MGCWSLNWRVKLLRLPAAQAIARKKCWRGAWWSNPLSMHPIEHDLDVVGLCDNPKGENDLRILKKDLYKRQGLLHQPSMPQCLST